MRRLSRLWHTVKWLRPVQFYGRLWFRLSRPRPDLRSAPSVRAAEGTWQSCARAPSMTGEATFRFLGVERELVAATDWNRPDWPKLWLYNAHYFDDLAADGSEGRAGWHRSLISRWVEQNPPGQGNGWEPYTTSLRIVNWVKWVLAGKQLEPVAVHSLAVQVRHLCRRLEVHLLGNHLWANAKALVFAGTFFEGAEADAWRRKGLALLSREIGEQILPDGGHFERSPMYHCILLEDLLDLIQLAAVYPGVFDADEVARWRQTAGGMMRWLRVMTHPDGGISFFNDAALGIAPGLGALEQYARAVGVEWDATPLRPIEPLPDSGYVRLQSGLAVVIADVGQVGPDYLPGHAHADTLSFELSLHEHRVLVNGGTSTYETDALRLQQRGTAMHNTVEVDGQDSSEVWGSFRMARRARPFDVAWRDTGESIELEAAHDGYRRLPGQVVHKRRWRLYADRLEVRDELQGSYAHARAVFRFSPGLADTGKDTRSFATRRVRLHWDTTEPAASVPGSWYPRFGEEQACTVLEVTPAEGQATTQFRWTWLPR